MRNARHRLAVGTTLVALVAASFLATDPGSPAAAAGTGEPQIIHDSLAWDGLTRTYRLYVPSFYDDPAPLLLALHGNGSTGDEFTLVTGYDGKAEQEGFITVYPDAVSGVWNAGYSNKSKNVDDVGFLTALVAELSAQYPIDADRVFVTGSSGGGMMSYQLACDAADLVAVAAPVASTMTTDSCEPSTAVSILHIHGDSDHAIPFEGREDKDLPAIPDVVEAWSVFDACTVGPNERTEGTATITSWSSCDRNTAIDMYLVAGLTHHFPIPERGDTVDAREISWDFFMSHPRTNGPPTEDPTLLVSTVGSGTGTVTSAPAGIDCGVDCSETYPTGTVVTLGATPGPGSTFVGWSGGGCSGAASTCDVTMSASTSVTATFDAVDGESFTLTVETLGDGRGGVSSQPSGIRCGRNCSEEYVAGTEVVLTAGARPGSTFLGWSGGGCSGTGATCTLSPTVDTTVTATFGEL